MLEEYDIDKLNPRINLYVNNKSERECYVADDREYPYHGPIPEDISDEGKKCKGKRRDVGCQLNLEITYNISENLADRFSIVADPDGKKIVLINDVRFKSRRGIDWNEIEQYLKQYIGKCYEIIQTSEEIYIGTDFPDEYAHSKDTKSVKGANEKAKANAISVIGELIEIASDKTESPDYNMKHGNKAKYGWYRYNTRFGIPVYSEDGVLERYNIFRARIIVRRDKDGKLYLYDVVTIKKETSKPLES